MYLSVVVIFAWVDMFSCAMTILFWGIVKFSVVDVNSCIVLFCFESVLVFCCRLW